MKVKALFELNNIGACGVIHVIRGTCGRAYKFTNRRNGRGYQFDFEGTPEEYTRTMRDLLDRRRSHQQVWLPLPPQIEGAPAAAAEEVAELEKTLTELAQRNEELETANADLRYKLGEKAASAAALEEGDQAAPVDAATAEFIQGVKERHLEEVAALGEAVAEQVAESQPEPEAAVAAEEPAPAPDPAGASDLLPAVEGAQAEPGVPEARTPKLPRQSAKKK